MSGEQTGADGNGGGFAKVDDAAAKREGEVRAARERADKAREAKASEAVDRNEPALSADGGGNGSSDDGTGTGVAAGNGNGDAWRGGARRSEGIPGKPAPASSDAPVGVSTDLRNIPGARLPMEQRHDADSLHPTGDTMAHNAGNAGPWHPPEYPATVRVAGLPGGLMAPRPDAAPYPGREIAPEPVDPGLVAFTGTGTGMTAQEEASVAHFRMRIGELRNAMRGFEVRLLGEGSPLHRLAVDLMEVLHGK